VKAREERSLICYYEIKLACRRDIHTVCSSRKTIIKVAWVRLGIWKQGKGKH